MAEQARGLNELMARYHLASAAGAVPPRREPAPRASKATAAAPGAPGAAGAAGAERRGASRPWAKGEARSRGPAGPPAAEVAATGTDAEWKEF